MYTLSGPKQAAKTTSYPLPPPISSFVLHK
ncbi:hypothetical protein V2J09_009474 [Rumex salicifolius]